MKRSMSASQFNRWKVFEELEVFPNDRMNFGFAGVRQALWNIARDTKKNPNGWPLEDFLLFFGDHQAPESSSGKQTLEYQELLINDWVWGHNAVVAAAKGRQ